MMDLVEKLQKVYAVLSQIVDKLLGLRNLPLFLFPGK